MSYKTILVHLNNERQAGPLLEFGVALARCFESRLIGLHVFPSFRLTPPVPLPSFCWEKTTGRQGMLSASSRSSRPVFRVLSISWSNPMPIRSVDIPSVKVSAMSYFTWPTRRLCHTHPTTDGLSSCEPLKATRMFEQRSAIPLQLLVGIDLTERSRNSYLRAVRLARSYGACLTLLHVTSDAFPQNVAAAHDTYATDTLRELAAPAEADDVSSVMQVVTRGRDYETILEQARKDHTDLIVIGGHRPSSVIQDMLLGTTCERLLRYSECPVLRVSGRPEADYTSIVVAVDFSLASRRALELAIRWFPRAQIAAATAYTAPRQSLFGDKTLASEAAETQRLALEALITEVERSSSLDVEGSAMEITPMVERGFPETVLPRAIEERAADLLVLGTHARTGLRRAVVGSVTEWILADTLCDVLVVPPH